MDLVSMVSGSNLPITCTSILSPINLASVRNVTHNVGSRTEPGNVSPKHFLERIGRTAKVCFLGFHNAQRKREPSRTHENSQGLPGSPRKCPGNLNEPSGTRGSSLGTSLKPPGNPWDSLGAIGNMMRACIKRCCSTISYDIQNVQDICRIEIDKALNPSL